MKFGSQKQSSNKIAEAYYLPGERRVLLEAVINP